MVSADDFTSFRAAHPSAEDAITACVRPDWLVQLAWELTDHTTAVSIGLGAAQLLSTASDTLWLFKPNPDRLETVAAWTGDDEREVDRSGAFGRAVVLAGFPAVALAYLIVSVVIPGPWTGMRELSLVGSIFVLEVVFTMLVRWSLAAIVRRRAAQLDDRAALDLVLDEIRKNTAANPQLVPIALKSSGNRLRRCLTASATNGDA